MASQVQASHPPTKSLRGARSGHKQANVRAVCPEDKLEFKSFSSPALSYANKIYIIKSQFPESNIVKYPFTGLRWKGSFPSQGYRETKKN